MDELLAEQMMEAAEQAVNRVEDKVAEFSGKMAKLRERLDDLVIQIAIVQADLEAGEVEEAQACLQDVWLILNNVDRRFRDLLA